MRKLQVVCGALACAAGVLGGSSAAWAGTVTVEGGVAIFSAPVGETNQVGIFLVDGSYEFRDAVSAITPLAGCATIDRRGARCDGTGVTALRVEVGPGNDIITNATATPSLLLGGGNDDVITGGSGPDVINGGSDVDLIDGGDGDDRIVDDAFGVDRPDRYACGPGNDLVNADVLDTVDPDCESVTRPVPAAPGDPTLVPGPVGPDPGPAVGFCGRIILGTAAGDRLVGGTGRNEILGLVGNDVLRGGAGADCLNGGDGKDRLSGLAGRDVLDGGKGADRVFGGPGSDRLVGGSGKDRLIPGGGRNTVIAGAGNDVIRAVNGRRDVVSCGRGRDSVRADVRDRLRGCERVVRVRR